MTREELIKARLQRGLSKADFGRWLADRVHENALRSDPDAKPAKYSAQRVYDWENGVVAVPAKIEAAILRAENERLQRWVEYERSPMAGHEPNPEAHSREELIRQVEERRERNRDRGRDRDR